MREDEPQTSPRGVGAEDAWFATALDVDYAMLDSIPAAGGAVDFVKCFDQVLHGLLYCILTLSGVPMQVLTA